MASARFIADVRQLQVATDSTKEYRKYRPCLSAWRVEERAGQANKPAGDGTWTMANKDIVDGDYSRRVIPVPHGGLWNPG